MAGILYLPISIGEALDKLSILDIKLDNISDNRRENVKIEYDLLYDKLKDMVEKHKFHYNSLKKTNLHIWNLMDILRDGVINDDFYLVTCKDCINANDMRFRIKDKINRNSNSVIKEQKGYHVKKCLFDINYDNAHIDHLIKIIYYYSLIYDEIYLRCNDKYLSFFENHLKDHHITILHNDQQLEDFVKIFHLTDISLTLNELYQKLNLTEEILNKYI